MFIQKKQVLRSFLRPIEVNRSFRCQHHKILFGYQNKRSFRAIRNLLQHVQLNSERSTPRQRPNFAHAMTYVDYEFTTLTDMLEKTCKFHGGNHIFGTRIGDIFEWMTYIEFYEHVKHIRTMFHHLGIKSNDRVGLISNNRWEWAAIAYGTMGLGAQIVPMYEAQLEQDWKHIIEDSDAKVIIVANEKIYKRVKSYPHNIGKVERILVLDTSYDKDYHFSGVLRKYSQEDHVPIAPNITEDHLATIIYTSGTTGKPKGVELSHGNIASNILGCKRLLKEEFESNVSLAFLPWAHVFGQVNELHCLLFTGSTIAIVPHRDEILQCLMMVKPTVIFSVPVFFNKVYEGMMRAIEEQSYWKKALVKRAFGLARKRNHLKEYGQTIPFFLEMEYLYYNSTVLQQLREKLGGNLQRMVSGGAASQIPVLHFFEDLGIPILEGYGLTEAASSVTAATIDFAHRRIGCVGVPLPGVKIRVVDPETFQELPSSGSTALCGETVTDASPEGEIVVSGPNVMKGYHKNDLANDRVFLHFDNEQWLRTGDSGRIIDQRFLQITGRIRELFKLENGKFVVPTPLEEIYSRGPYIHQCFVTGINQSSTALLVVPDYAAITAWAKRHEKKDVLQLIPYELQEIPIASLSYDYFAYLEEVKKLQLEKLFRHEDFILLITEEIVNHGEMIPHYSRPTLWTALMVPFSQENQQLTVKLTLKRQNIALAYEDLIRSMYRGHVGHRIHYNH